MTTESTEKTRENDYFASSVSCISTFCPCCIGCQFCMFVRVCVRIHLTCCASSHSRVRKHPALALASNHHQDDGAALTSNPSKILSASPALCWLDAEWARGTRELWGCLGAFVDFHQYLLDLHGGDLLTFVDHWCIELHLFSVSQISNQHTHVNV